jgi:hypothetical protein
VCRLLRSVSVLIADSVLIKRAVAERRGVCRTSDRLRCM